VIELPPHARELPKVLYKFAERRHAHLMCNMGVFRIGTLIHFQNEEAHEPDIGDASEGTMRATEYVHASVGTEALEKYVLPKKFLRLHKENKTAEISNCTFEETTTVSDMYIYCFSQSRKLSARSTKNYDTVVEIVDPLKFVATLSRAARLFTLAGIGKCQYVGREFKAGETLPCEIELLKLPKHSFQEEWRAAWPEYQHRVKAAFNIWAPEAARFCRMVEFA
jgi:hypothetical protein